MMTNPERILASMSRKYRKGLASPEEKAFLEKYYSYFDREAKISESLTQEEKDRLKNKMLQEIRLKIRTPKSTPVIPFYRRMPYRIAAALCCLFLVGTYMLMVDIDVKPGGPRALLTLADGSEIVLQHAKDGPLSSQGKTTIIKQNSGQLIYSYGQSAVKEIVGTNKITTPCGGEYQVTLPDGTNAWLNAASSIKFPTAFKGKERIVEISGEVYLEVAKDATKPFIVKVNDISEIKVLGTHFNINAYPEEGAIKTTLLEGSVQVSQSSGGTVTLVPGQQSEVDSQGKISVKKVDPEEVLAWKNGNFQFDGLGIDQIMTQICRWYDVEVAYQNGKPQGRYSGIVSRNTNLSEVLDMLELSGIHSKIESKKLIVIQK